MKLYLSPGALLLLVLVYLPLTVWLLRKCWKSLSWRTPLKILTMMAALIAAVAVPLWDVVITSVKMLQLCPEAGITIKRSVEVEGFYTNFGTPEMLDRGFKYIESNVRGEEVLVLRKEDGSFKSERFAAKRYQIKSRYEFLYDFESGPYEGRRDIAIQKAIVRDRQTKEVLGTAVRYAIFPGWVDRYTVGLVARVGWACQASPIQELTLQEKVLVASRK